MEGLIALLGVVVGTLCTYFLTLARDRRQEAQREAVAMFELRHKCEELKLHTANPDIFDTAFFSGNGIDDFLSKNGCLFGTGLSRDLFGWRKSVRHYLWFEHRQGRGSSAEQERLVSELEMILKKKIPPEQSRKHNIAMKNIGAEGRNGT